MLTVNIDSIKKNRKQGKDSKSEQTVTAIIQVVVNPGRLIMLESTIWGYRKVLLE